MTAAVATAVIAPRRGLSAAARARLEGELIEIQTDRATRAAEPANLCGDAADIAELANRDMFLEQLDRRIAKIKDLLVEETWSEQWTDDGTVRTGVQVTLKFGTSRTSESFVVGDIEERDDTVESITPASPLGRALIGAHAGDTVEYRAPGGTLRAKVVAVRAVH